jgi:hypothetical protein
VREVSAGKGHIFYGKKTDHGKRWSVPLVCPTGLSHWSVPLVCPTSVLWPGSFSRKCDTLEIHFNWRTHGSTWHD